MCGRSPEPVEDVVSPEPEVFESSAPDEVVEPVDPVVSPEPVDVESPEPVDVVEPVEPEPVESPDPPVVVVGGIDAGEIQQDVGETFQGTGAAGTLGAMAVVVQEEQRRLEGSLLVAALQERGQALGPVPARELALALALVVPVRGAAWLRLLREAALPAGR